MSYPLSPGERYLLTGQLSALIEAQESGDRKRSDRVERRVSDLLGRFYRGRRFAFCGFTFAVNDDTPIGIVSVREVEQLD